MMTFHLTSETVATHRLQIRKDSEHGICKALRPPNPASLTERKGTAPVTPVSPPNQNIILRKEHDDAKTYRRNQCKSLSD